ncbi:MAG: tetratricopeptide repeat protein [Chloroflexi bacterium]|nr:tetratricopeptide repeat protein [Chloroflexota bacterium]
MSPSGRRGNRPRLGGRIQLRGTRGHSRGAASADAPVSTPRLPGGTITFLLTDVEGSTGGWERAPDAMRAALARHDELIERLVVDHGGVVVRSRGEGDSRFAVFVRASDAAAAAYAVQRALVREPWPTPTPLRVRIALHTGEAQLRAGDYYGSAVNRCARLRALAHGGQVLLSGVTAELVRDSLPQGCSLRDLGQHYLKDLSAPERIWQLTHCDLPAEFLPLASAEAQGRHLPAQLTSFVGREVDIEGVLRLLRSARLVTLTGAGGIGKTRLALEAAADVEADFGDGVWLVELASLADSSLVTQTVAASLGVHEQPQQALITSLINAIGGRRVLLILDNCEHLIERCAELADTLLRGCPSLTILATSREPMGIDGEVAWRVPPLAVPAAQAPDATRLIADSAAVRLFVERARAVRPGFSVSEHNAESIANLCRRLDGIPLALELAAAWVAVLSVDQIVARLDHTLTLLVTGNRRAPARHQTLRATLDWSYALLPATEQALFQCLSVFAGGWTLASAESVCGEAVVPRESVLDLLAQLVKKSLALAEPDSDGMLRYRLLEPVRQYAQEQLLNATFAEEVRRRHALHYLELAQLAEPALHGADRAIWLDRLESEHDNLRAALAWSESIRDVNLSLRLAGSLSGFWAIAGHLREGLRWLDAALAAGGGSAAERARARGGAGRLALLLGDLTRAREDLETSLVLVRQVRDTSGIVDTLNNLGRVALDEGDIDSARACFDESLALARAIGDRWGTAFILTGLAQIGVVEADYERARGLFSQALTLYRNLDSRRHMAVTMSNLACVLLQLDQVQAACNTAAEALDLVSHQDDLTGLTLILESIAVLADARSRPGRAQGLRSTAARLRSSGHYQVPASEHAWPAVALALQSDGATSARDEPRLEWSYDEALTEALAEVRATS